MKSTKTLVLLSAVVLTLPGCFSGAGIKVNIADASLQLMLLEGQLDQSAEVTSRLLLTDKERVKFNALSNQALSLYAKAKFRIENADSTADLILTVTEFNQWYDEATNIYAALRILVSPHWEELSTPEKLVLSRLDSSIAYLDTSLKTVKSLGIISDVTGSLLEIVRVAATVAKIVAVFSAI